MTATSIRLRRHKGYVNSQNSEARNARNFEESVPNEQEEPVVAPLETEAPAEVEYLDGRPVEKDENGVPILTNSDGEPTTEEVLDGEALPTSPAGPEDEDAEVQEANARRQAEADAAEDAALSKPSRNQSKETWTTYVGALHTKPEGYSEDLSRDQIADLVLGPKA